MPIKRYRKEDPETKKGTKKKRGGKMEKIRKKKGREKERKEKEPRIYPCPENPFTIHSLPPGIHDDQTGENHSTEFLPDIPDPSSLTRGKKGVLG